MAATLRSPLLTAGRRTSAAGLLRPFRVTADIRRERPSVRAPRSGGGFGPSAVDSKLIWMTVEWK